MFLLLQPAGACCWGQERNFIIIFSYNLHSWTIIGFGGQTQRPKPKNDGQKSYLELKKILNS